MQRWKIETTIRAKFSCNKFEKNCVLMHRAPVQLNHSSHHALTNMREVAQQPETIKAIDMWDLMLKVSADQLYAFKIKQAEALV